MTLEFLNPSRSHDGKRHAVTFWGHDGQAEVTFQIHDDELLRLRARVAGEEDSALRSFDAHRAHIESVAQQAYARRPATFCRLYRSDF